MLQRASQNLSLSSNVGRSCHVEEGQSVRVSGRVRRCGRWAPPWRLERASKGSPASGSWPIQFKSSCMQESSSVRCGRLTTPSLSPQRRVACPAQPYRVLIFSQPCAAARQRILESLISTAKDASRGRLSCSPQLPPLALVRSGHTNLGHWCCSSALVDQIEPTAYMFPRRKPGKYM